MRYEWSNERGPTANQDCQRELEDKSVRYKVRVYIVQYRCTLYNMSLYWTVQVYTATVKYECILLDSTGVHCTVQYECTLYSIGVQE